MAEKHGPRSGGDQGQSEAMGDARRPTPSWDPHPDLVAARIEHLLQDDDIGGERKLVLVRRPPSPCTFHGLPLFVSRTWTLERSAMEAKSLAPSAEKAETGILLEGRKEMLPEEQRSPRVISIAIRSGRFGSGRVA